MKKLFVTCAIVACSSVAALAQNANTGVVAPPPQQAGQIGGAARPTPFTNPEQRQATMATNQTRFLEKQYGLDAEQFKGAYAVCLEFVKGMDAMRQPGKQPSLGEFEKLENEKDAKLKGVMTPEQFAKYSSTRMRPGGPAMTPMAAPGGAVKDVAAPATKAPALSPAGK